MRRVATSQHRVTLVHSSDLHIGDEETTRACGGDETLVLARVLDAARAVPIPDDVRPGIEPFVVSADETARQ